MKIGKIPIASIILIVYSLFNFVSKHYFPTSYNAISPYIDGGMVGAMLVFGLYYADIYITAWMNNRRETISSKQS
jgi:hypothetical protein